MLTKILQMQRNFWDCFVGLNSFLHRKLIQGRGDLFTDRNKRMGNLSLLPLEWDFDLIRACR
jgi:hypothetical protein